MYNFYREQWLIDRFAGTLAQEGLLKIDGESARATDALVSRSSEFENTMKSALEALHAKHAFERG